jgi:hypothetical protein
MGSGHSTSGVRVAGRADLADATTYSRRVAMMADLLARRALHSRTSQAFTNLDDNQFAAAIGDRPPDARRGWGDSYRAELCGFPVFVKRLPLTDEEKERPGDTSNIFGLPDFYHYGVGSAGFGASREVAGHLKATAWILDGAIESFPMLYHSRVLPRPERAPDPRFELQHYVQRWNGSEAIRRMMVARAEAKYELCLVLEPFAHTLGAWLPTNQETVGAAIDGLCRTLSFLRSAGLVHFDAHPSNVVGDGNDWHLVDFGLLVDEEFDLDEDERAFLRRHRHYDTGELLAGLGSVLLTVLDALDAPTRQRVEQRYGVALPISPDRALQTLLGRLDDVAADSDLAIDGCMVDALVRYREVILYMATFLSQLRRNPRKDTTYDDAVLRSLLVASGASL